MKNCILFANVCLLILFVGASSLAQNVVPQTPQPGKEQQRNPQPVCPLISVSCPSDIDVGKPLVFQASLFGGDSKGTLRYDWEVSGGVIAEGQGTPAIIVNPFKYQTVTATLHVGGLDPVCTKITASCSMPIFHPFPPAQKFDSYGVLPINEEKARLVLFAAELKNQPGTHAYIFGYDGPPSPGVEAQKSFVDRAKTYLVDKLRIDPARVITVDGGFKGQLTIDLYLVPVGSIPPAADPAPGPTEVKPMKATANKSSKRPIRS